VPVSTLLLVLIVIIIVLAAFGRGSIDGRIVNVLYIIALLLVIFWLAGLLGLA
jgi:hypothetical protein